MHFTFGAFMQFMQDLPFAKIGQAVASGGTNIPIDIEAAQAIAAAAAKDFFTRTVPAPVPDAPATVAAAEAHVQNTIS